MVQATATAFDNYPTAVAPPTFELVACDDESTPAPLAYSELTTDRRVAVRKISGEVVLAKMAGKVDRNTVRIRQELDAREGRYDLAEFVQLRTGDRETAFFDHPQACLPGIDFETFIVSNVPRIIVGLRNQAEPPQAPLY